MSNLSKSIPPTDEQIEEALAQFKPRPGEQFQRRLASAPWTKTSPGETPMNFLTILKTRRALALALLVAVTVIAGTLATPWGRALAQSLFQFFPSAAGESFPLPPEQIAAMQNEPSPELQPTAPPPPTAVVPECENTFGQAGYLCRVQAAEKLIGFDAKVPPSEIRGLTFTDVTANATAQDILITYNTLGGAVTIWQGRSTLANTEWGAVPPTAPVEQVTVNGFEGEYVHGMFVAYANATEATWNPDAPLQRLRWREGEIFFEIAKMGDTAPIEYLTKEALIELAESLR